MTHEDKKEQIASCFQKHFNHFGYKKTSVDDIAKELQISKKTIYQFFNTKEQIFHYIISKVARKLRRDMEKQIEVIPSYRGKINKLLELIFEAAQKWLKKNDAFEFRYKYDIAHIAFQDAYHELLKQLIDEGNKVGEFPDVKVDLLVRFIAGIISESMKLVSVNPDLEVIHEVVIATNRLLVGNPGSEGIVPPSKEE